MNYLSKLSSTSISIIVSNVLLLLAVFIFDWDVLTVFVLYIIETIIIGLFHLLKMIGVYFINQGKTPTRAPWTVFGLVFILLFFTFHFGIFVFIQTVLVLPNKSGGFLDTFLSITTYLDKQNRWFLWFFVVTNLITTIKYLFIDQDYEGKGLNDIMMEPYPRIFVQQFVVIFGSFFLAIKGLGVVFLFIFIITKTTFELLVSQFTKQYQS